MYLLLAKSYVLRQIKLIKLNNFLFNFLKIQVGSQWTLPVTFRLE